MLHFAAKFSLYSLAPILTQFGTQKYPRKLNYRAFPIIFSLNLAGLSFHAGETDNVGKSREKRPISVNIKKVSV